MNKKEFIEVFIINFNGKNTVIPTIQSILNSKGVDLNITVIDDCSTDNSIQIINETYPDINVIKMPYNIKHANVLRNKALEMSSSEFVFITDNDIKYDENCLSILLSEMKKDNIIATCTPRLMYWDQPDKIYMASTKVHYIGAAISEQRDTIQKNIPHEVTSNSGSGICLIRRSITTITGGFDQNLLQGWGSDGEFYQRLMRAGYECLYVSSAYGFHEDKLNVFSRKHRVIGQTHNRWVFIFSHYSLKLIILLIPAFIIYELFEIVFILIKGLLPQYIKGNYLFLKNYRYVIQKRKFVKSIKKRSDFDVLYSGTIYVAPALIEKFVLLKFGINSLSTFLNIYWKIIKNLTP